MSTPSQPKPSGSGAFLGHTAMQQVWGHSPLKKQQAKIFQGNLINILQAGEDFANHLDGKPVDLSKWTQNAPENLKPGPNPFLHPTKEEEANGIEHSILHVVDTPPNSMDEVD